MKIMLSDITRYMIYGTQFDRLCFNSSAENLKCQVSVS